MGDQDDIGDLTRVCAKLAGLSEAGSEEELSRYRRDWP